MKVLLFGAGENADYFWDYNPASKKIDIVGIVDNDDSKWGLIWNGLKIESPDKIKANVWDRILVTPNSSEQIFHQLHTQYDIEETKIITISDLIVPKESNLGSISLQCDLDTCYEISELVPDKIIPDNELEEFYLKNSHKVMNKWWHYFEVYHMFLQKYKGTAVRILEIGVFKGGSMEMWKNYFGEKASVIGIDIDENCKEFEKDNVKICIGSQADQDFLEDVSRKWGPFDIVLDDGSHKVDHQLLTFETLFPLLSDGGVYICEDCHTSYIPSFGGGYHKKGSFIEYSKHFADCVNSQHVSCSEKKYLPFYSDDIKACHYYDSMVVIEKQHRGYPVVTEFGQ